MAIVDWDLHHGNGTQHSFYEDPRVLFVSTHQYPHYPGTGGVREVGAGLGEGYTVNVPLPSGCGDEEYLAVFQVVVGPLLEAYHPELILVSAGFDTHELDPLGGMDVTEDGYEEMLQVPYAQGVRSLFRSLDPDPRGWLQPARPPRVG